MSNNSDFGLIESFNIDDGELDGRNRQECFVLGYELAQVSAELESGAILEKPIHADNADRIRAAAKKRNRAIEIIPYHDDWFWLKMI